MQINDCIVDALGSSHINDLLVAYFQSQGASSNNINDAEREFLIAQGMTVAGNNAMWYELLYSLGYSGSLTDMWKDFWCISGGAVTELAFYATFVSEPILDRISKQTMITILESGRPIDMNSGVLAGEDEPALSVLGLLTYGAYTNLISYSEDILNWTGSGPWTQSVNLSSTGTYTISTGVAGATVTVVAGTATLDASASATLGSPDQFVVTGTGTVIIETDVAEPKAQLTESTYRLPYMPTDIFVPVDGSDLKVDSSLMTLETGWSAGDGSILTVAEGINGLAHTQRYSVETGVYLEIKVLGLSGSGDIDFQFGTSTIQATITEGEYTTVTGLTNYERYGFRKELSDNYVGTFEVISVIELESVATSVPQNYSDADEGYKWAMAGLPLLLDALDGEADGTTLNSGNLISGTYYVVITTETDHFGAGVVVGDRVTGLTTALDTNNTVQVVDHAQGEMQVEWTLGVDYDDLAANDVSILTCDETGASSLLFHNGLDADMESYDNTTVMSALNVEWVSGTKYTIKTIWGTHPVDGVDKMQIIVTDGTTTWESSVVDFDGSFDPGEFFSLAWDNIYPQTIKSIKVYKEPQSW